MATGQQVDPKITAGAAAGFSAGTVGAVVSGLIMTTGWYDGLREPVQTVITAGIPVILAFLGHFAGGYVKDAGEWVSAKAEAIGVPPATVQADIAALRDEVKVLVGNVQTHIATANAAVVTAAAANTSDTAVKEGDATQVTEPAPEAGAPNAPADATPVDPFQPDPGVSADTPLADAP